MPLFVLKLEDRILFDAAAHVAIAHVIADHSHTPPAAAVPTTHIGLDTASADPSASASHDNSAPPLAPPTSAVQADQVNVLLVASNIDSAQQLADAAAKGVITIMYDFNNTTLSQLEQMISNALDGKHANSISFATEGQTGLFHLLQNVDVTGDTLASSPDLAHFWSSLGNMMTTDGRVDLLGCFVGGSQGDNFGLISGLDNILDANGADRSVAAATHLVGNIQGANWTLDDGNIDASKYFDAAALGQWSHDLATFTVSNNGTTGAGSFFQAVTDMNSSGGNGTINFTLAAGSVIQMNPVTAFIQVPNVFINGTTAPGYVYGSAMVDLNDIHTEVDINGGGTSVTIRGLEFSGSQQPLVGSLGIQTGNFDFIENCIFTNGAGGIRQTGGNSFVLGCQFGENLAGTAMDNQTSQAAIEIAGGSMQVGDGSAANRNTFAPQVYGMLVDAGATATLQGNYFGTTKDGLSGLLNPLTSSQTQGVSVDGGTATVTGNLFAGLTYGVTLSSGTVNVEGNRFGTNINGVSIPNNFGIATDNTNGAVNTLNVGNTSQNIIVSSNNAGIDLEAGTTATILNNSIGIDTLGTVVKSNDFGILLGSTYVGTATIGGNGTGNVISGNAIGIDILAGTADVYGNHIGTDSAGTTSRPNTNDGIAIVGSTNSIIGGGGTGQRNFINANGANGIEIQGGTGTVVAGNYIGVESNGTTTLANGNDAILISGGTSTTIGGSIAAGATNLLFGSTHSAIQISGGSALIEGNLIGPNATGSASLGETNGILISSTGSISIGGGTTDLANTISGNATGISISNGTVTINGNYIGTNSSGSAVLANTGDGILITGGTNHIIGVAGQMANVISGNGGNGIELNGSTGTTIYGNTIGLNAAKNATLSNQGDGIKFNSSGQRNAIVGGISAGQANIIAHNVGEGVRVNAADGVTIRGNSIYDNGDAPALGINLGGSPIGNDNQQPPTLTGATYSSGTNQTTITGTFVGTAGTNYVLDFYANPANDGLGIEGKTWVGQLTGSGAALATFTFVLSGAGPALTTNFTSTATVTTNTLPLNTSEFSPSEQISTITLANSPANVTQGQSVTIATSNLDATDTGETPAQITFTITALPVNGTLFDNGVAVPVNGTFTQQDINNNLITYTQNGSATTTDHFTFNVTDPNGQLTGQIFNINIKDIPTSSPASVSTSENTTYTFLTTDFTYHDATPGDNEAGIRIDQLPTTGTLVDANIGTITAGTIIPIADINSGAFKFVPTTNTFGSPYTTFNFSVEDSSSPNLFSTSQLATVNVNEVAIAPTSAPASVSTPENATYVFNPTDFTYHDVNAGDNEAGVRIDQLPTTGTLVDANIGTITAGTIITIADINSGAFKFVPTANTFGSPYTTFNFSVEDSSSPNLFSSSQLATVNVNEVAIAPTSGPASVSTTENATYVFSPTDFTYHDVNAGDNETGVRIDQLPTTGTLVDANIGTITAGTIIPIADINSGAFQFVPAHNTSGAPTFNFSVEDSSSPNLFSSSQVATVNVTGVPPTSGPSTISAKENINHTLSISDFPYHDAFAGNNETGVMIIAPPTLGTLVDNGVTVTANTFIPIADITGGKVVFDPAPNTFGTNYTTFTFAVRDSSNPTLLSSTNTATVNVAEALPTTANNNVTTTENTNYQFQVSDFPYADANNAIGGIRISSAPPYGTLVDANINGGAPITAGTFIPIAEIQNGNLYYKPPLNSHAMSFTQFGFAVGDSSSSELFSANKIITVNVTQGPTTGLAHVTTAENVPYTFKATDFPYADAFHSQESGVLLLSTPDYGTLSYNGTVLHINQSAPTTIFIPLADITSGKFVFTPLHNTVALNYTNFAFKVVDSTSPNPVDSNLSIASIDVTGGSPSSGNFNVNTVENTTYVFKTSDIPYADPSSSPLAGIMITSLPAYGRLVDLNMGSNPITPNTFIPYADISAGQLQFIPANGVYTKSYAQFGFSVRDSLTPFLNSGRYVATINVSEAPPTTNDFSVTTPENVNYAFSATDFPYSDVNSGDKISGVEIIAPPTNGIIKDTNMNGGAAITANTFIPIADIKAGDLIYKPADNTFGSATFTFEVVDSSHPAVSSVAKTATVNVTQSLFAPSSFDPPVATDSNTPYTFKTSDFPFFDLNPNDKLAGVKISSLPANGSIVYNNVTITSATVIPIGDIANGLLRFVPSTSTTVVNSSFQFSVQDNSGNAATEFSAPVDELVTVSRSTLPSTTVHSEFNDASQHINVGIYEKSTDGLETLFNTNLQNKLLADNLPVDLGAFIHIRQKTQLNLEYGNLFHGNVFFKHSTPKVSNTLGFSLHNGTPVRLKTHDDGYGAVVNALEQAAQSVISFLQGRGS